MATVKTVDIDTGNAVKSLSDLRKQINELKNNLYELDEGSEEYKTKLDELGRAQTELSDFMTKTSKSCSSLEGSYNALVYQMANLKKAYKETTSEAERSSLGKQINDINNQLKDMDANIGDFGRNVGNYQSALQGLGVQGLGSIQKGIAGVKSGADILSKHPIIAIVALITAGVMKLWEAIQKNENAMNNLKKAMAPLEGLFNVISDAVGKLVEWLTEGLASAMETVTSLASGFMTILGSIAGKMGFEGIADSIENVNKHMRESVAIAKEEQAIVSQSRADRKQEADDLVEIAKLRREFELAEGNATKQAQLQKEIKEKEIAIRQRAFDLAKREYELQVLRNKQSANSTEDNEKELDLYIKMKNAEAQLLETSKEEKKVIKSNASERKKALEEAKKLIDDLNKEWAKSSDRTRAELKEIENKDYNERVANLKKLLDKKLISENDYNSAIEKLTEGHNQRLRDIDNKFYDTQIKNHKAYTNAKIKNLEESNKAAQQGRQEEIDAMKQTLKDQGTLIELRQKEAEIARAEAQDRLATLKEQEQLIAEQRAAIIHQIETEQMKNPIDESALTEMNNALLALDTQTAQVNANIQAINTEIKEMLDTETVSLDAYLEVFAEMSDQMSDFVSELSGIGEGISGQWSKVFKNIGSGIEEVGKALKSSEKGFKKWAGVASQACGTISAMFGALADEQNQESKEGFESYKKLQVAQATMSMLQGIITGWSSAMQLPYPANIIAGASLTAMTSALGAVQISKIRQQQFEGGEDVGSLSASASSASATPSGAVIQNTVQAPVQWTSEVQGMSQEGAVKDTRVYVLESDITSVQNRVAVAEQESTF